jgi:hypothetical protein
MSSSTHSFRVGSFCQSFVEQREAENFRGFLSNLGSIADFLLKVHKNENFFGFDFEFCSISMLVMHK